MSAPIRYLFTLAVPVAALALGALWFVDMRRGQVASYVYDTVVVERGEIRRLVSTSGPVRAVVTVAVGSQLSGQIRQLGADFNSEVKAGDVLAVLDDQTFAARVAQARADVAAARAQLANQEAALARAEAVKQAADRTEVRQKTLAAKGIAAQASLDNARRDMETASADMAVARAQINAAKAAIAQKEAMLQQAQIDLDRTRIRSPIDGTVISRTIDVGQTVAASLQAPELFKIAQDLSRIQIEAQVNEADVGQVKAGNPVSFRVDAYPERSFAGRVGLVRLAATELQNVVTYTVVIEAENADRVLFPGMTANVSIETARRDDVLRVAAEALRFRPRADAVVASKSAKSANATGGDGADAGSGGRGGAAERTDRMIEALKRQVGLTDEQATTIREALAAGRTGRGNRRGGNGGAREGRGDGGAPAAAGDGASANPPTEQTDRRAQRQARLDAIILSSITAQQRPAFEAWKRNRDTIKAGALFVVDAAGKLVQVPVRLGLGDDQSIELLGRGIEAGTRVAVRTRKAGQK